MSLSGKKQSFKERLLEQLILFAGCVVFPGLVTFVAPASWLTFERSDHSVHCTARTCVFFVVPFRTQWIDEVEEIASRAREARTEKKRVAGRTTDQTVHVDGEGFLQIKGDQDRVIEVSVSPFSLERATEKANAFLKASEPQRQTLFVIANWKFGAIMGGILTSFTALYVVGYTLEFFRQLFILSSKCFKRLWNIL